MISRGLIVLRTSQHPIKTTRIPLRLSLYSTMAQSQTPSKACCNTPPIVGSNYQKKGEFVEIDGLKTYQTGSTNATKALLVVYDIFGYFPQTLQGADILATSDNEQKYAVFMPDFFEGKPADITWYPPDNKEKEKLLGEFFKTTAAPPKTVARIPKIIDAIKTKYPSIKDFGVLGFCWGGKIVSLSSAEGTPFKAAASAHPAMVDPADAPEITIPTCMLPSKDEDKEAVSKFQEGLKVKNVVEWFPDQIHGWLAARGDLKDPKVVSAYEKGYQTLLSFFHEHL